MFIMTNTFLPCHGNRSRFSIRIKVGDRNVEVGGKGVTSARGGVTSSREGGGVGACSPGNF